MIKIHQASVVILLLLAAVLPMWSQSSMGGGGGGTSSGGLPPNSPGIPQQNGNVFYATNYGVKANTLNVKGCSGTSGLSTITCTGGVFSSGDVGKIIWASGTSNSTPDLPQTTIATVVSATVVTTVGTLARNMTSGEAVYGNDDTTAINAMWSALTAAPNCGTANFPAGGMIIQSAVMASIPTNCNYDQDPVGTSIFGQGPQNTIFYPSPNFTYFSTSSCTAAVASCFGPTNSNIWNLEIYGGYGGNLVAAHTFNGAWLTLGTPGNTNNIVMQGYIVPGTMQTVAIVSGNAWMNNTQIFGFGGNGSTLQCTALYVTATNGEIVVLNSFIAGTCNADGANMMSSGTAVNIISSSGNTAVQNPWLVTGGTTTFIGGMNNNGGIKSTGAGTIVNVTGLVDFSTNAALSSELTATLGGTITAANSSFKNTSGSGTNYAVTVDSTSKFVDACGNTLTANTATANVTAGGLFIPCLTNTYQGSPSVPTLAGTGSCATFSTQKGTIYYGQFTCTGTTGAATITVTPGTTASNGFRCNANDISTVADTVTPGAPSVTSCAFSATAIASGDVVTFNMNPY